MDWLILDTYVPLLQLSSWQSSLSHYSPFFDEKRHNPRVILIDCLLNIAVKVPAGKKYRQIIIIKRKFNKDTIYQGKIPTL